MKPIIKIFAFLFILNISAQKPSPRFLAKSSKIINEFVHSPALRNTHLSVSIRNLENDKEFVGFNSGKNMAPASNLKLLYTLTSVAVMGKDYRFKTKLYKKGKLSGLIFFGDLIFQTSGDPSFASIRMGDDLDKELTNIVSKIKSLKINRISGYLVMELNGWRYPAPGTWPIEDVGNYYGTGAWDFNFNDNRINIYLQRSEKEGESTKVLHTEPEIDGITYISKVTTAAPDTDDESYVYAAPFDTTRYILGTIPAGKKPFKVKGGMPNPPLNFLKILKQKLLEAGIIVKGIKIKHYQEKYDNLLWEHTSKPLIEIAKTTNDYSINHFSEALAWLLINGDMPANGYMNKEKINEFFKTYGFETADIEDGCGLAPDNLVQTRQMTHFLKLMKDQLGLDTVLDILPHAGEDGYAKYFMKESPLQKQIWVKSGSISKVRNYTGIFKSKSGKYYSFSVMTNFFTAKHKEVKKEIEKLVENYIKIL